MLTSSSQVSWNDVQAFIEKLNAMEGTEKYRLPTEAEWEYACRAGSTTAYCFGNDPGHLGEFAWYGDNSNDKTHPVGQKKPNAWGLYDMHGNVWEWVQDRWGDYPSGSVTDPEGLSLGSIWSEGSGWVRVSRGGSYKVLARICRSASRSFDDPYDYCESCGFPLLRTVDKDRYEPDGRESLEAEQSKMTKKQLVESKHQFVAINRETARRSRFITCDNGTVLDTSTNLMWAAKYNGRDIEWQDAKNYCENYRGGGYSDWRMPTNEELAGIYDTINKNRHGISITDLIEITREDVWSSETRGSAAAFFSFSDGFLWWDEQSEGLCNCRALPVRSDK